MADRIVDDNNVIDFVDDNNNQCFEDDLGNYTCVATQIVKVFRGNSSVVMKKGRR